MSHRIKSFVFVLVFLCIVCSVGYLLNRLSYGVTAAAVRNPGCKIECVSFIDCEDNNSCTKNVCLKPDTCDSKCIFEQKEKC